MILAKFTRVITCPILEGNFWVGMQTEFRESRSSIRFYEGSNFSNFFEKFRKIKNLFQEVHKVWLCGGNVLNFEIYRVWFGIFSTSCIIRAPAAVQRAHSLQHRAHSLQQRAHPLQQRAHSCANFTSHRLFLILGHISLRHKLPNIS